jgi:spermidine synthase
MNKTRFIFACLILGFSSMVSQIVLLREMIVSFYGNELSLGVMLFVWLFWVGMGSWLGDRLYPKNERSFRKLFFWYLLAAFVILATLVAIRYSKIVLGVMPGEVVGFVPMLVFSFVIMAPLCLISGILFVLNSRFWKLETEVSSLVTRVYLWESIGAGMGGLLTTFLFIPHLFNFHILALVWIINLLLALFLIFDSSRMTRSILISCGILILIFFLADTGDSLQDFSLKKLWRGLPIVHSEDTIYGNIGVIKEAEQITFYENGLLLFSYPDEFSAEEAVLFALSQKTNPQSLLLIGGGIGGAIAQAQKYKDLKIDYVELDPRLIELSKDFLPRKEINSLEKTNLKFQDGRLYVKEKSRNGNILYDVVILNLPDPYTAMLNRFYTSEFFQIIKRILKKNGIFSFRVTSQLNYISDEQGLYLSSLYRTLKKSFENVAVLPGHNNIFLASPQGELLADWKEIVGNLKKDSIQTLFVSEYFLPDRLSPQRVDYLQSSILSKKGKTNYDLSPVCYFYNTILWSTLFQSAEKPLFLWLADVPRFVYLLVPSLITLTLLFILYKRKSRRSNLALSAIFMAGYTSIFLEIIVLLGFQIFYGYVYSKMGLILTVFMLGLGVGAYISKIKAVKGQLNFSFLSVVQLIQVILPLVLLFLFTFFAKGTVSEFWMESSLLSLMALCGIVGGLEFTTANHLFLQEVKGKNVGTGYSIDLLASAISSILVSAILIPLIGIQLSLWGLILINMVCFGYLLLLRKNSPAGII